MKNIKSITLDRHNSANYKLVEEDIYRPLDEPTHRVALQLELEEGECSQYPLEDILDKFMANTTDLYGELKEGEKTIIVEFETEQLEDARSIKELIGKRVYNKEVEDGKLRLLIE